MAVLVYSTFPIRKNFPHPDSSSKMLASSQALFQDAAFVRADLYDIFGKSRFGELFLFLDADFVVCWVLPDKWKFKLVIGFNYQN